MNEKWNYTHTIMYMESFKLYIDSSLATFVYKHSFIYKNNFIRTKALVLAKNLRTNQEQSQACCPAEHKNKVSKFAISKIIRAEHQNRVWLSLILQCM